MAQRIIPARSGEAKLAAACREACSILSAVQPLCGPLRVISSTQGIFIAIAARKCATLLAAASEAYTVATSAPRGGPAPPQDAALPYPEEGAERTQGQAIRQIVAGIGRPLDGEE